MYIFLNPENNHGKVQGLCGNFNGKTADDLNDVSTGKVAANAQEFGNLWKISGECPDIEQTSTEHDPCVVSNISPIFV